MADSKSGSRLVGWAIAIVVIAIGTFIVYQQVKPPTETSAANLSHKTHTVEVKMLGSGPGAPPANITAKYVKGTKAPQAVAAWMEIQVIGDGKPAPGGEFNQKAVNFKVADGNTDWPVVYAKTADSAVALIPAGYAKAPANLTFKASTVGNPNLGSWQFPPLPTPNRRLAQKTYPTSVEIMPGVTIHAIRAADGIQLTAETKDAFPEDQVLAGRFGGHSFKAAVYPDALPRVILTSGRRRRGSMTMLVPMQFLKDIDACDVDLGLYKVVPAEGQMTLNGATLSQDEGTYKVALPGGPTLKIGSGVSIQFGNAVASKGGSGGVPAISANLLSGEVVNVEITGTASMPLAVQGSPAGFVEGRIEGNMKNVKDGPLGPIQIKATANSLSKIKDFKLTIGLSDPPPPNQARAGGRAG